MDHATVTHSTETIHNPADARHFMRVKPVKGRVRARVGDVVIADSTSAQRVMEVGRKVYDPVFYFPPADVLASLAGRTGTTHCPLKGDAIYFDIVELGDKGEKIAWCYDRPLEFSDVISGLIAFYADRVSFEEMPLS